MGGFNENGIHKDTGELYNKEGFDKSGYDEDGFDEDGFDERGFDEHLVHKNGSHFDDDGFDFDHFDENGRQRKDGARLNKVEDRGEAPKKKTKTVPYLLRSIAPWSDVHKGRAQKNRRLAPRPARAC